MSAMETLEESSKVKLPLKNKSWTIEPLLKNNMAITGIDIKRIASRPRLKTNDSLEFRRLDQNREKRGNIAVDRDAAIKPTGMDCNLYA